MKFSYLIAYLVFGILFAEASQSIASQKKTQLEGGRTLTWPIYTIVVLLWPLLFVLGILLVIIEGLKK